MDLQSSRSISDHYSYILYNYCSHFTKQQLFRNQKKTQKVVVFYIFSYIPPLHKSNTDLRFSLHWTHQKHRPLLSQVVHLFLSCPWHLCCFTTGDGRWTPNRTVLEIFLPQFFPKTSSCWKLWEVPLEKIHHVLSGCLSLFGFKTRTWRSQKVDEKKLFRLSRQDPSVARGRMLKQHLRLIGWATCKVISNNHSLNTERLLLNRSSLKSWNPKVWWWEKGCDYQRSFPLFSTTKRADILPE